MFFRRGIRDDEWLGPKIGLFLLGALLAVAGMTFRHDWLIGAAGLVLLAGILLRFIPRPGGEGDQED